MTVVEFQSQLRATGAYETAPERRPHAANRPVRRRSARYYWKLLKITLAANRIVRRGAYDGVAWAASSFQDLQAVESCGGAVSIDGLLPRARTAGPVVYVANHMSMLETFLLPCVCLAFGDVAVVVKESLLDYPFFGPVLRAVRPVSVGRRNPREDLRAVMEAGTHALAAGRSMLVFPQATRRGYFDTAEFNTLGVKLAGRGGVPVVPLALKTDFQSIGRWLRDFGPIDPGRTVCLRFGEPLAGRGSGKEQQEAVVAFITRHLRAWGVSVRGRESAGPGPPANTAG